MNESVLDLFKPVRENKPGSVDALLTHPRVREIVRVRAQKRVAGAARLSDREVPGRRWASRGIFRSRRQAISRPSPWRPSR
jgi:hypothetical protein